MTKGKPMAKKPVKPEVKKPADEPRVEVTQEPQVDQPRLKRVAGETKPIGWKRW